MDNFEAQLKGEVAGIAAEARRTGEDAAGDAAVQLMAIKGQVRGGRVKVLMCSYRQQECIKQ